METWFLIIHITVQVNYTISPIMIVLVLNIWGLEIIAHLRQGVPLFCRLNKERTLMVLSVRVGYQILDHVLMFRC